MHYKESKMIPLQSMRQLSSKTRLALEDLYLPEFQQPRLKLLQDTFTISLVQQRLTIILMDRLQLLKDLPYTKMKSQDHILLAHAYNLKMGRGFFSGSLSLLLHRHRQYCKLFNFLNILSFSQGTDVSYEMVLFGNTIATVRPCICYL